MKNKKHQLTSVLHEKQLQQIKLRRLIKEKARIRKEIVLLEELGRELKNNK